MGLGKRPEIKRLDHEGYAQKAREHMKGNWTASLSVKDSIQLAQVYATLALYELLREQGAPGLRDVLVSADTGEIIPGRNGFGI